LSDFTTIHRAILVLAVVILLLVGKNDKHFDRICKKFFNGKIKDEDEKDES